jgi:hypothetical protein
MFQGLTNAQIHLKPTVCAVCDDIVQLVAIMLCGYQAGGVCMMDELHDKYTFVNKSNLNFKQE